MGIFSYINAFRGYLIIQATCLSSLDAFWSSNAYSLLNCLLDVFSDKLENETH